MRRAISLGMVVALAGIYLIPLCPNAEMLAAGGRVDKTMCAEEVSCCSVAGGDRPLATPTCCDATILAFERRDADASQAPLPMPPTRVEAAWPEAAVLAFTQPAFAETPVARRSSPPSLLSLRL